MNYESFIKSLENSSAPNGLKSELLALWYDKKGDWDKAHKLIQHEPGINFAHIHAYLHRKEGNLWNANYWYTRANEKMPDISIDSEWEYLLSKFID